MLDFCMTIDCVHFAHSDYIIRKGDAAQVTWLEEGLKASKAAWGML